VDKLGLIAGGGDLPLEMARACEAAGRPLFVIRLAGMASPELERFPGAEVGLAELGKCVKALKGAGCTSVAFAGNVRRPDFASLKPDLHALKHLPGVMAAARKGDDALLRSILAVFEKEGFAVEATRDAAGSLILGPGPFGANAPGPQHQADIEAAVAAARAIGQLDIGQAAVVCDGVVLAVEAQEGTDALLMRCAGLPQALRGAAGARRGVLAKTLKPGQDLRVDLPTIGTRTVELAAEAGLAGIVGEAGALLVVDAPAVRAAADRLGLFLAGVGEGASG
jgi:DUF1009 family protein